jgi:hypothetical protein
MQHGTTMNIIYHALFLSKPSILTINSLSTYIKSVVAKVSLNSLKNHGDKLQKDGGSQTKISHGCI